MRARVLVIQHEDECPPGWFGEWLEAAGLVLDVVRCHRGDPLPETLSGYDGLLVLGGEMGAYDEGAHPWLTATKELIADAVAVKIAFLGICLGHQLATAALGGAVARNPAGIATGLTPVQLTGAGRLDPLLGCVASGVPVVQWNKDIVTTLPAEATVLALAPDGTVQAARFGAAAWGVQFHPEVSPEIFASWGANGASTVEPRADLPDINAAAAAVAAAREQLWKAWRPLADRFAEIVRAT